MRCARLLATALLGMPLCAFPASYFTGPLVRAAQAKTEKDPTRHRPCKNEFTWAKRLHARAPLVWQGSEMPDLRKGTKATRIVRFSILTGWERDETRGDFGKPKAGTAR